MHPAQNLLSANAEELGHCSTSFLTQDTGDPHTALLESLSASRSTCIGVAQATSTKHQGRRGQELRTHRVGQTHWADVQVWQSPVMVATLAECLC